MSLGSANVIVHCDYPGCNQITTASVYRIGDSLRFHALDLVEQLNSSCSWVAVEGKYYCSREHSLGMQRKPARKL